MRIVRFVLPSVCFVLASTSGAQADEPATYVGSSACAGCHASETAAWRGSHHDLAMQEATDKSVLGNFDNATFTYGDVTSRFFRRDDDCVVPRWCRFSRVCRRVSSAWRPARHRITGRESSAGWDTRSA